MGDDNKILGMDKIVFYIILMIVISIVSVIILGMFVSGGVVGVLSIFGNAFTKGVSFLNPANWFSSSGAAVVPVATPAPAPAAPSTEQTQGSTPTATSTFRSFRRIIA